MGRVLRDVSETRPEPTASELRVDTGSESCSGVYWFRQVVRYGQRWRVEGDCPRWNRRQCFGFCLSSALLRVLLTPCLGCAPGVKVRVCLPVKRIGEILRRRASDVITGVAVDIIGILTLVAIDGAHAVDRGRTRLAGLRSRPGLGWKR